MGSRPALEVAAVYKKVDHVFGDYYLNYLLDKIEAPGQFPWFFYANTQTGVVPSEFKNSGFRHTLIFDGVNQSAWTNLFLPIAWKVSEIVSKPIISVDGLHVNMIFNHNIEHVGEPHLDVPASENKDHSQYTAIYYMDDTNGCTTLYDDKGLPFFRNPSTADSLLIFSANIKHSGGLPTDAPLRRVVNINITCPR